MALRPSLTAALLTAFLVTFLAGCTSPAPEAEPVSPVDEDTMPSVEPDAEQTLATPAVPEPVVLYCPASRTNLGTPAPYGVNLNENRVCDFDQAPVEDWSLYASALVEIAWDSLQPTITAIDGYIESEACFFDGITECRVAGVRGSTNPLTMALEGEEFTDHAAQAWVVLSPEGVANEQPFDVYVSLFPDAMVPGGYSAIPA